MPDTIVVTDPDDGPITVTVVGEPSVSVTPDSGTATISVGQGAGPPGPQGIPGVDGDDGATGPPGTPGVDGEGRASFEHPVMIPDDDYIVTHNEGVDPAVVTFLQAGSIYNVYWEIVDPGVSIRVTHWSPTTGKAILVF